MSSSENSEFCVCGKKRHTMNTTNWTRHLNASKIKKANQSSPNIASFFTSSNTKKHELEYNSKDESVKKNKTTLSIDPEFKLQHKNETFKSHSPSIFIPPKDKPSCSNENNPLNSESFSALEVTKSYLSELQQNTTDPSLFVNTSYSNMSSNLQNLESLAACEVFKANGLSLTESQHINDPHLYINVKMSSALLQMLTNLGPLQPGSKDLPGGEFPKSSFSGTERSFSEVYYKKETNNDTHSRQWLAYSLIVDRVYCWTCRLYGTPKAQNNIFSTTGCNDWKHLSTRLKDHESCKVHLESEISRAMYVGQNRIDLSLIRSRNTQVSKNREIVRVLMDIILYLSKYDSAFRGHNEKLLKNDSVNQEKFIGLTKLLSNYHPILLVHLENMNNTDKKKRLTYMSKDSQNAMLEALAETLRDEILQKAKNAGMFSVIIDTTTDNAKIDQLAFVIRYCSDDGEVFERLVGIDEVNDSSGKGMFDVFCKLCERYGLNWRKQLIGQAYDGASNMQSELKGLRGYIQAQNPSALNVWCFAHCLNLAVVDACNANEKVMNFFGTIQTLLTFLGSRKRTHLYVQCQKELCSPTQRIRRLKHFSDTRWTYHDRAIEAVQITYGAILKTLKTLSNQKSNETDIKSKTLAKGLLKSLNSFEFIVIMFMMRKIFNSTTPLSNYLQSSKLDFVEAMKLVKATRNELFHLRNLGREQLLECFINEAKTFCEKFELNERNCI